MRVFRKSTSVIILISLIITQLISAKVFAYTFNPASGTYNSGDSKSIQLLAAPTISNASGVNIDLVANGMTITNFVAESSGVLVLPCSGGSSPQFTSTTVCVSIAKTGSGTFSTGELLGTITATFNGNPATLTKKSDNEYVSGSNVAADPGSVSYTVNGGTVTLPNTAISDNSETTKLVLFIGLIVVAIGLGVVIILERNKNSRLNI